MSNGSRGQLGVVSAGSLSGRTPESDAVSAARLRVGWEVEAL